MDFAELIKEKRMEKGLSINKVGNLCEISPSYIMRLERTDNIKKPSFEVVMKIVRVLEIKFEELMKAFDVDGYLQSDVNLEEDKFYRLNGYIKNINKNNKFEIRDVINILEEAEKIIKIQEFCTFLATYIQVTNSGITKETYILKCKKTLTENLQFILDGLEKYGNVKKADIKEIYFINGEIGNVKGDEKDMDYILDLFRKSNIYTEAQISDFKEEYELL